MIKLINYVKILIILSVITLNNIWNLEFSFFCFDIKDPTCNLNINLESNHTMDNSYNYEFNNNLIYTTELGYGLITLDDFIFQMWININLWWKL